jgi:hypothetical protein
MNRNKSRLEETLETSPIFRIFLLLARNREKIKLILVNGKEIEGRLYAVDSLYRAFKVETENGIYIVNWRHVVYIEYKEQA